MNCFPRWIKPKAQDVLVTHTSNKNGNLTICNWALWQLLGSNLCTMETTTTVNWTEHKLSIQSLSVVTFSLRLLALGITSVSIQFTAFIVDPRCLLKWLFFRSFHTLFVFAADSKTWPPDDKYLLVQMATKSSKFKGNLDLEMDVASF